MKRFAICVLVCIVLVMSFSVNISATERTDSLLQQQIMSDETTARVYEEVLSGDITSHDDVITVALEQYKTNLPNSESRTCVVSNE